MNSRGLALITVILLVAFVIVLSAGFYVFVNKFTSERIEEVTEDEGCNDVSIKILEACYNSNDKESKIKIESKGSRAINNGFLIITTDINGKTTRTPSPYLTSLESLNIIEITVSNTEEGMDDQLKEIEVIPKIKNEDDSQSVCPLQAEKIQITPC